MSYPDELLPKIGYQRIDPSVHLRSLFLIRRTKDNDIFDASTEQIKNEYLEDLDEDKRFLSWSCNLYTPYRHEFLKFNVTNRNLYLNEWDFKRVVKNPVLGEDYNLLEIFGSYLLGIEEILSTLQVPYNKEKKSDLIAKPYLYHCPNDCNFWHFEIRWVDADNNLITNKNMSTWKNNLVATMRSYLRNFCIATNDIDPITIPSLDKKIYCG